MLENTEGVIKKDNPEKTLGPQEADKRKKNTTQYVLDITMRTQIHITQAIHAPYYKQLEAKTKRASFFFAEIVTDMTTM